MNTLTYGENIANFPIKGRGAYVNPLNRITKKGRIFFPFSFAEGEIKTTYLIERAKRILNEICSPDLSYGYSLNPYQGCEHGCVYCYARETHQYYDLSAGLDFETIIYCKINTPEILKKEITSSRYEPKLISISGNTDPYQPIEKKLKLTRKILEILYEYRHPFAIVTKSNLICRDIDILELAAKKNLCTVSISLTTLDEDLRLKLEPRASSVHLRLKTIEELSSKNIYVHVLIAPVIPYINSDEVGDILNEVHKRGAKSASFSFIRLNGPLGEIFEKWLDCNFPYKKNSVLKCISEIHGGSIEDRRFFLRHHGEGVFASTFNKFFDVIYKKIFENKVDQNCPQYLYNFSEFKRSGWLF